ncbi:MAG TPA: hypothetical protein VMS38_22430, partial [Pseudorhodoferax sp.]|nr:hypothetical protein [Pseudorhodoferax sp.]
MANDLSTPLKPAPAAADACCGPADSCCAPAPAPATVAKVAMPVSRKTIAIAPAPVAASAVASCCASDTCADSPPPSVEALPGAMLLRIPAMDCAIEENQIRRALEGRTDMQRLRFDLGARCLSVEAEQDAWPAIQKTIESAGFKTEMLSAPVSAEATARAQRTELWRLLGALGVAVVAELLHLVGPDDMGWRIAGMAVAALAIGLSGLAVFQKGLTALMRRELNINALMSVAVIGAFFIGQWPEAAMVMTLYALAELIEARSVERARNAIAKLLALSPAQVEVQQP